MTTPGTSPDTDTRHLLQNRVFDDISVGETATIERTLTVEDIQLFAALSGDINPTHVDPQFAATTQNEGIVAHSMWSGALVSAVLGTKLPGPGTVYKSQTLQFESPIKAGDLLRTTVTVTGKDPATHTVQLDCRCTNQHEKLVAQGQAVVVAPRERVSWDRGALPDLRTSTSTSSGNGLQHLLQQAKGLAAIDVAVVHPCDTVSLTAALDARDAGLINPVLVAPREKLFAAAKDAGVTLDNTPIVDVPHSHAAAAKAVELACQGKVEALMKGSLHTDELMGAVVSSAGGLRTKRRVSHCFLLQTSHYPRPFIVTDAAINLAPNLEQKADIVRNAIDLAHVLGVATPRVAILAAVETVTPGMPATLDAAALCKMADRGQISGGVLDGPLAFDNSVSVAAAALKGIKSDVAGQADILVVPDLESGNMLAKQLIYMGDAASAGIVLGARVPIVLTSRADSRESRISSCAIAVLLAHHYRVSPP